MGIHVTNHEEHALTRRFDHNGDGQISMEEFYNCLAQEFWAVFLLATKRDWAETLCSTPTRCTIKLRSLSKLQVQNQS